MTYLYSKCFPRKGNLISQIPFFQLWEWDNKYFFSLSLSFFLSFSFSFVHSYSSLIRSLQFALFHSLHSVLSPSAHVILFSRDGVHIPTAASPPTRWTASPHLQCADTLNAAVPCTHAKWLGVMCGDDVMMMMSLLCDGDVWWWWYGDVDVDDDDDDDDDVVVVVVVVVVVWWWCVVMMMMMCGECVLCFYFLFFWGTLFYECCFGWGKDREIEIKVKKRERKRKSVCVYIKCVLIRIYYLFLLNSWEKDLKNDKGLINVCLLKISRRDIWKKYITNRHTVIVFQIRHLAYKLVLPSERVRVLLHMFCVHLWSNKRCKTRKSVKRQRHNGRALRRRALRGGQSRAQSERMTRFRFLSYRRHCWNRNEMKMEFLYENNLVKC